MPSKADLEWYESVTIDPATIGQRPENMEELIAKVEASHKVHAWDPEFDIRNQRGVPWTSCPNIHCIGTG